MEMPYLYEEGPRTETRIMFRVANLNLEGDLICRTVCKGVLEMRKGSTLQKGLQIQIS